LPPVRTENSKFEAFAFAFKNFIYGTKTDEILRFETIIFNNAVLEKKIKETFEL
jgi:hypothetical protein